VLTAYDWPGNVRELRNVMRRAVMLAEGDVVDLQHLPPELASRRETAAPPIGAEGLPDDNAGRIAIPQANVGIKTAVEQLERGMITNALREHHGNQTRAAAQLGITRQALAQKIAKYGIGTDG
jgi:DNA-binding NtrC family response regulator